MGHLAHDQGTLHLRREDHTLAHLQIVIVNKLRRRESFAFSWVEPVSSGSGRGTIWLHPSANLLFRFDGNRLPAIDDGSAHPLLVPPRSQVTHPSRPEEHVPDACRRDRHCMRRLHTRTRNAPGNLGS